MSVKVTNTGASDRPHPGKLLGEPAAGSVLGQCQKPILAAGPPPGYADVSPSGSHGVRTQPVQVRGFESSVSALIEGRYLGGDGRIRVELRIDASGAGVISGELATDQGGMSEYLASFRTEPGRTVSLSDCQWPLVVEDASGSNGAGTLILQRHTADQNALFGSITVAEAIAGLPIATTLSFAVRYRSRHLRSVGLEIESERDVGGLPTLQFRGESMSVTRAWENAGIALYETGRPDAVPQPITPWGTAQLHGLMYDLAQSQLHTPGWELRLLWLSRSARDGLLGVMFDDSGVLPRQGLAVFADEIRSSRPHNADRKLIQTTVHEMGHALNLAHRFERTVGRADSTSFMNYDWRYLGGRASQLFWNRFEYRFDPDELEFLRHGPRHAVIPGGAGFHQVRDWPPASGGFSPYGREVRDRDLELRLLPPPNGGMFLFGQPVLLGLALRNVSTRNIELPKFVLDAKAGFIEITISRMQGRSRYSHRDVDHFHPIMVRDFDLENTKTVILRPGRVLEDNVNLTFGSGGFSFAEPGTYKVTAHLVFTFDLQPGEPVDLITSSQEITIRVAYPHSLQNERDGVEMLSGDAGTYIALGGSRVLASVADKLAEISERRLAENCTDPIGAAIRRCRGIDAGRAYVRFESGRFNKKSGDAGQSATLLKSLTVDMLQNFDSVTAKDTQALAVKQESRSNKQK